MGYPHGTVPTPPGVTVHPTPIYEVIIMALVVWVLWRLATRYDKSGWWTFGWFLVLSGIERFFIEFLRINPVWFWHLTQPQWVSIVSVLIGGALILAFSRKPAVVTNGAAAPGAPGDAARGPGHPDPAARHARRAASPHQSAGKVNRRPFAALKSPAAGRWARGRADTAPCR